MPSGQASLVCLTFYSNINYIVIDMTHAHLGEFECYTLSAILGLGDRAYGVRIKEDIEAKTGRAVAIGAVYTTLSRLEKKGFVRARTGESTPVRGGRAKRYYCIQPAGREALKSAVLSMQTILANLEGL